MPWITDEDLRFHANVTFLRITVKCEDLFYLYFDLNLILHMLFCIVTLGGKQMGGGHLRNGDRECHSSIKHQLMHILN